MLLAQGGEIKSQIYKTNIYSVSPIEYVWKLYRCKYDLAQQGRHIYLFIICIFRHPVLIVIVKCSFRFDHYGVYVDIKKERI